MFLSYCAWSLSTRGELRRALERLLWCCVFFARGMHLIGGAKLSPVAIDENRFVHDES